MKKIVAKRKNNYDNLKGIMIFFVVFAHLLLSYNYQNSESSMQIVRFIYFFHMPILFIISGFFSTKKLDKKRVVKLIILFLIMNLSFSLYEYLATGIFDLFTLKYSSWYVLLLLIYRLLIHTKRVQKEILNNRKPLIILSLLLAVTISLFNIDLFILRLFGNGFYFLTGYLYASYKDDVKEIYNSFNLKLLLVFCLGIVLVITCFYSNLNYYMGSVYSSRLDVIIKFIICITNLLLFFIIINLISNKEIPLLTRFGRNTLTIYVLHRIPTILITNLIIDNKFFILIAEIATILLCLILSNKIVVETFNKIVDFLVEKYCNKNKFVYLISVILFLILLFFSLSSKRIINFNKQEQLEKNEISIGFVGDLILLEEQVKNSKSILGYDFDYMFKYTKEELEKTDYTIGVFEGVSNDSSEYSVGNYNDNKELRINMPSKFIKSIKESGIDLVTTANNHIYDKGYNSVKSTIANFDKYKLDYVGTYTDKKDKEDVKIVEVNGLKIGVLAYTFGSNYQNDTTNIEAVKYLCDPDSNEFSKVKKEVANDFKKLKEKEVDLIIVLPHYGTEFNFDFSAYQEKWNEVFALNGASIIFGDHSHVIGPIKYYDETLAVASPGNYVNSYNKQDSDISYYVKVYLDKKSKKIKKTTVLPMLAIKKNKGYYPVFLSLIKNNKRVSDALALFGKVVLNDDKIALEKEYVVPKSTTLEDKLELTSSDKESLVYKKIEASSKVCFIGDSITEGSKNGFYPWYLPLMKNFDKEVVNIAKKGYTSFDILKDYSNKIKDSDCDLTVINIGTNDIRYNMLSPSKYLKNIEKIISLLNKNSEIILLAPWLTYSSDKVIGDNIIKKKDLYGLYNEELKTLARESSNINYLNPNRYITSKINKDRELTYLLDGVHPNSLMGIKLYSFAVLRGESY